MTGASAAEGEPEPALSRRVTIVNQKGLHARAAAKFVRTAASFTAQVRVSKDDLTVTGTSILGLMMLAAGIGSELLLQAEGEDAPLALAALTDLVGRGFDE